MRDGILNLKLFADLGLVEEDLPCHDDRLKDNPYNTKHLFDKSPLQLRNIRKNLLEPSSKS